jgi:hypothetical protein
VNESDVMSNKSEPGKDKVKAVELTVSKAAYFKNRKLTTGNSLSLREYKELSEKDVHILTPSEQKQLAKTRQQVRKMTEAIASQYDFSGIAKIMQSYVAPTLIAQQTLSRALEIHTTPMLKIVADMQKLTLFTAQPAITQMLDIQKTMMPAIQTIYQSTVFTQNQFTALAAVQKSLALTMPMESLIASIKGIQEAFQAPLIARTMFADFQNMHERILRDLTFDVGSLSTSIEFTRSEVVDFAIDEVTTDDDTLIASATATQTNTFAGITFTNQAAMQLILNKLDENNREITELKQQLLARDSPQGQILIAPSAVSFKRSTSSIQIGSYRIGVSVSSKQTQFARVLLSTPQNISKKWDIEEVIFEAFGERIANDEKNWITKIRSYIHQLNNKVLRGTNNTMPNFFVLDGIEVFVNSEYLNQ